MRNTHDFVTNKHARLEHHCLMISVNIISGIKLLEISVIIIQFCETNKFAILNQIF